VSRITALPASYRSPRLTLFPTAQRAQGELNRGAGASGSRHGRLTVTKEIVRR
jgi:hypothetical protein